VNTLPLIFYANEMKNNNKKYHSFRTTPNSKLKILEAEGKIDSSVARTVGIRDSILLSLFERSL
jgi:hypothetical protein